MMSSQAAAVLAALLLAGPAAAAPHFNCRPGSVAFETVHLPDRNVVFLRQGPGCPHVAPKPHAEMEGAAAIASEDPAALVDDSSAGHGGLALPASDALHVDSPKGRAAGLLTGPTMSSGALAAGILLAMVLMIAASRVMWERTAARQRKLLAEQELQKASSAADVEDGSLGNDVDALRKAAEEEAEQLAREAAKKQAIERAEAKAQKKLEKEQKRLEQEQAAKAAAEAEAKAAAEAAEAVVGSKSSATSGTPRRKGQYDDNTRAYRLARQEEEERKSQQEKAKEDQKAKDADKKKGCCGGCCSAKQGVSEPQPGRR